MLLDPDLLKLPIELTITAGGIFGRGLSATALTCWEGYGCTPTNAWTFATTGGDSVHYSVADTDGSVSEQSPVVMMVPMADSPNYIVGADLRELLALGLPYGWSSLEQVAYSTSCWEGSVATPAPMNSARSEHFARSAIERLPEALTGAR